MLERIMVALDGSPFAEQALPFAAAVGFAFEAEFVLLRVVEGPNNGSHGRSLDSFDWRVGRAEAIEYLSSLKDDLEQRGLDVDIDVTAGRASDEILEMARLRDISMVVVGSHGHRGLTRHRMASTAQKVVFGCDASVLVVPCAEREREGRPFTSVLVPVDGSPHGDWAVSVAARLARYHEVDLIVLHVVQSPRLLDPQGTEHERHLVDELVALNTRAAERYVGDIKRRLEAPGMVVDARVDVATDVVPVLERHAAAEERPLVVLSARGQSRCEDGPYGSLVTVLLTHAHQPVLVLRDGAHNGRVRRERSANARKKAKRATATLGS
jgi:nucleotide-binding universal stress UspA family protein